MRVEDELKALIVERFKSVRAFAIAIDMPYSTINNIFDPTRGGVGGAGISKIIPLCRALNLDVDALADQKIKFKDNFASSLSSDEQELLSIYCSFNDEGKEKLVSYAKDLIRAGIYKKDCQPEVVSKEA